MSKKPPKKPEEVKVTKCPPGYAWGYGFNPGWTDYLDPQFRSMAMTEEQKPKGGRKRKRRDET